jgi:hypothetical protein
MTRYSVSAKVMRYRKKDKWEKPLLNGKGFFFILRLALFLELITASLSAGISALSMIELYCK